MKNSGTTFLRRSLLPALLLASVAGTAAAQDEKPWSMTGLATWFEADSVRLAEAQSPSVLLLLSRPFSRHPEWALELGLSFNELAREGQGGYDTIYQLEVSGQRRFDNGGIMTPYLAFGLGASFEEIRGEDSTQPVANAGFGLLWQLSETLDLRFDARALFQDNDYESNGVSGDNSDWLVDGRFGLGLTWNFGRASVPVAASAIKDGDSDGVADAEDLCPDSLPDAKVDSTGCEALVALDSDGDGVEDRYDRCPNTPAGDSVDELGCGAVADVVLEGVNFELNSDQLTAAAKDTLEPIAELLKGGLIRIRVEIAGHTDSLGSDDYNQALSARRAWSVKNFLAARGIAPSRMIASGYGSSRPIADNDTEEGRAKNRRVVFRVVE